MTLKLIMTLLSACKSNTIFVAILCKLHTSSRPPPTKNTLVYVIVPTKQTRVQNSRKSKKLAEDYLKSRFEFRSFGP